MAHRSAPAPLTPQRLLVRSRAGGRSRSIGPTELASLAERIACGDRGALGGLGPFGNCTNDDVWEAAAAVFGEEAVAACIDASHAVEAAAAAGRRLALAASAGARVAFATAAPASMLPLYLQLARLAQQAGATVVEEDDSDEMRFDGRVGRRLRWLGGVAVVTDGVALLPAEGPEAAQEWLFLMRRPALVVADGPFVDLAFEAAIETVAFAGLDRLALAVASARSGSLLLVPVHGGLAPAAYSPVLDVCEDAFVRSVGEDCHGGDASASAGGSGVTDFPPAH